MAAWKQLLIAAMLLIAAAFLWTRFYPGAPELLARWGIDWASAAVPPAETRQDAPRQGNGGRAPQGFAVTQAVGIATINDRLSAIGTGRDNATVALKPYSAGRLTEILVEPGQRIAKGDIVARLDSETESIAVDRARIALEDTSARVQRVTALRSSSAATTVQVTDAQIAEQNAKLALRDAELALERRAVVAPIDGVVGILPVEAGNYVTTDTEIATLSDRSSILVDFWVPERYAASIAVGEALEAISVARPNDVLNGTVSAVDTRIDAASRTLLVRARLDNAGDTLRAGMSFQVTLRFPGDRYPAVNPLAIQWGTDGAFIWVIREEKAARVPVRIVQRNTETVLVAGDIREGEPVVTQGVHLAREGAKLDVGRQDKAPETPEPAPTAANPPAVATGNRT